MFIRVSAILMAAVVVTGCATNSRRIKLQEEAALVAENQGLWTRPSEVGFKLGDEITGTAVSTRVLGFNVGEAKNARNILNFGVIDGTGARLSSTGQFAAYKAVTDAKAEGIYVTRVQVESKGVLVFWTTETVTVYGRALTLTDYGPVDQERADEWRFREYGPKVMVIKEGEVDVGVNTP